MIGLRLYKEQIFDSALSRVDPNAEINSGGVPAYPVRGMRHREIPATIGSGKASGNRLVKIGWRARIVVVDENQNVGELPRRIHSVELLSRVADVTTDPVESGIVAGSAHDVAGLRVSKFPIKPIIAGGGF